MLPYLYITPRLGDRFEYFFYLVKTSQVLAFDDNQDFIKETTKYTVIFRT